MASRADLGAFRLDERVSLGSTGSVWRGTHRRSGLPVAIKVLDPTAGPAAHSHFAFETEVRAVAGLDHPHIVRVFDHGVIDAQVASWDEELSEGAPYLVMEYAGEGTLSKWRGRLVWPRLRRVLDRLLTALGHAHAHGLVHLDLKPANVLLGCRRSELPGDAFADGLRLADFGIAWREGQAERPELMMGTVPYMAPEQIRGKLRLYGPWTDLYALGCLAWAVASGSSPFANTSQRRTLRGHLRHAPPPLRSALPVPTGFQEWLLTLLRKDPASRFQRAEDARQALAALGDARDPGPLPPELEVPSEPSTVQLRPPDLDDPYAEALSPPPPATPPPWAPSELRPAGSIRFQDAGLALFGLRPRPLVGRDAERQILWETLEDVRSGDRPRLVIIRGAVGSGVSSLGQWLIRAAEESGGALTLPTTHSLEAGPQDGVMAALSRFFGVVTCSRDEAEEVIAARLGHVRAGWNWLGPELAKQLCGDGTPGLSSRALIANALEHQSQQRPTVALLDQGVLDPESLAIVEHSLQSGGGRIMWVLTVTDGDLNLAPESRAPFQALLSQAGVRQLMLGELDRTELTQLLGERLQLDGHLQLQLVERAEGSPLVADQMLQELVRAGALEPGRTGFRLREGEQLPLPRELSAMWAQQLAYLELSAEEQIQLERAAVLGVRVSLEEWEALGGRDPRPLAERLRGARLMRVAPSGYAFAHGTVREVVVAQAAAAGRLHDHHAACAEMLHQPERLPDPARIAHHLLGSGRPDEAFPLLLREAQEAGRDQSRAFTALRRADQALAQIAPSAGDPRIAELLEARCRAWMRQGLVERVLESAAELLECGTDPSTRAHAHRMLGWATRSHPTRRDEADHHLEQAKRAFERSGDIAGLRDTLHNRAALASSRGQYEAAETELRRSIALSEPGPEQLVARTWRASVLNRMGRVDEAMDEIVWSVEEARRASAVPRLLDALRGHGSILRTLGRLEEARAAYMEAYELNHRIGNLMSLMMVLNDLGDLARAAGRLDEAVGWYRRSRELCDRMGRDATVQQLNLALVLLHQGRFEEALTELTELETEGAVLDHYRRLGMAAAEHGRGAVLFADQLLDEAIHDIEAIPIHDTELAGMLEAVGSLALTRREGERAHRILSHAQSWWSALGRMDAVERIEERLLTLDPSLSAH